MNISSFLKVAHLNPDGNKFTDNQLTPQDVNYMQGETRVSNFYMRVIPNISKNKLTKPFLGNDRNHNKNK